MLQFAIPYLLTLPILAGLDFLWLRVVAKDLYRSKLEHLLSPDIRWGAAAAFYIIFAAGLWYFAVAPVAAKPFWGAAAWLGAFYGFFTYAAYDLTNLATLKQWSVKVTILDMAWGTFLGGVL